MRGSISHVETTRQHSAMIPNFIFGQRPLEGPLKAVSGDEFWNSDLRMSLERFSRQTDRQTDRDTDRQPDRQTTEQSIRH